MVSKLGDGNVEPLYFWVNFKRQLQYIKLLFKKKACFAFFCMFVYFFQIIKLFFYEVQKVLTMLFNLKKIFLEV